MAASCETLSYAVLLSLVNRAAYGFGDGIPAGRLDAGSGYVAVMLENGILYLAMSCALKKIDLVEVSINRAFRDLALARMINLTSCETLLSHRYAFRTAENMIGPFRIIADDVAYTPYPLSNIGSAFYNILLTPMTGGRVMLRDGFNLSNFWLELLGFSLT